MILNHKDAFNEAIQNKERFRKLSYADIECIHSVLTKKLGISKNVRSGSVAIVGTRYKPLANSHQIEKVAREMVDLINKKAFSKGKFTKIFRESLPQVISSLKVYGKESFFSQSIQKNIKVYKWQKVKKQ
jgi:hypothetical protein